MKRAGGVIASGVIGIVGSLVTILLGISLVVAAVSMRSHPLPQGAAPTPVNVTKVLVVEAIVLCGFGIVGIVSAVRC
jgi:hypothetical protein